MKDRKILTLHEVLNLDRRPTLQEMVDLYIEDYTKYLFEKGIIGRLPDFEKGEDIWSLNKKERKDYNDCEFVSNIIDTRSNMEELYDEDYHHTYSRKEIKEELSNSIENGILYVNEEEFQYIIKNNNKYELSLYTIKENGDYVWMAGGFVDYMKFYDNNQMLNEKINDHH